MTVLAHEIMTPSIKAVPQSWTMERLARFLTDNEITGSPVVDESCLLYTSPSPRD